MVSLISKSKEAKILEPSCGEGVFLKNLLEQGFKDISAFEIDTSLGEKYKPFISYRSFISSPVSDKYDVIIGNPPYIRWKNIEKELKEELITNDLWNQYFNSLCDYLFIFILKSIIQLKDRGELIFICSEYWLNTTNSQTLRNFMCQNGYFTDIYHFKETPLFDNVTASLIVFKFIKFSNKNKTINFFSYQGKTMPTIEELISRKCFVLSKIPQFEEDKRWILAEENIQNKIEKLEQACTPINSVKYNKIGQYVDIANGMVSGLDKAFSVQTEEYNNFNKYEKSVLINVLKAKDLGRYRNKSFSKYIFVPQNIPKEKFLKYFPNIEQHLIQYKTALDNRYQYNRQIPYWEFVFPRSQKLFEKKCLKIFVPCKERISNKAFFRFCIAPHGYFPLQDVTCIIPKDNCKEHIYYILAYLNSTFIFDWLKHSGIVKGYIVEFSEKPISQIPFREIQWSLQAEIDIHNEICEEVKLYLDDMKNEHIITIETLFSKLLYGKY
ncbi:MAG: BREX-1 system adenine-specific DNA-methyltransferase PglX [Bacteroidales bacterium]|nr:BREX-1 system adenine-specific DNA-methyltransferase PglX [Bacteroidales bacterium]